MIIAERLQRSQYLFKLINIDFFTIICQQSLFSLLPKSLFVYEPCEGVSKDSGPIPKKLNPVCVNAQVAGCFKTTNPFQKCFELFLK